MIERHPAAAVRIREPGDLWIVGATVAWIAYSLLLRAWPSALNATERLGATAAGGLVVIAPFAAWELWVGTVPVGAPGLGLIVLVRTFLSFSLEIELEGALPWRRNQRPREE